MVVQKYRKLTGLLPRIVHKDFRLVPYQIRTIKHNSPVMESSKTLNLKGGVSFVISLFLPNFFADNRFAKLG